MRTILVDDVDGSDAAETVTFGLDGVRYEIDLSDDNAKRLRASLQEWTKHGRRAGGRRRGRTSVSAAPSTPAKSRDLSAVREWARENGHTISDRGRVARDIQDAYDKAHASSKGWYE